MSFQKKKNEGCAFGAHHYCLRDTEEHWAGIAQTIRDAGSSMRPRDGKGMSAKELSMWEGGLTSVSLPLPCQA